MSSMEDNKQVDIAHIEDLNQNVDPKDRVVQLAAAQEATLQEAKSIRQTIREDRKVFMVVAAALVHAKNLAFWYSYLLI